MKKVFIFLVFFFCHIFTFGAPIDWVKLDSINQLNQHEKVKNASSILKYITEKINDPLLKKKNEKLAQSFETLNIIYYYNGNYDLATECILKAIRIYEKEKNYDKLIDTYAQYGYQIKRRDMVKAEYYMNKALKLINQKNIKNKAYVLDNYGVLKEMQNQLDSAYIFYNQSLKIKEILNDSLGITYCLNKVGKVYQLKKNYTQAEKYFNNSLEIRLKLKDTINIAESYGFLGELNIDQKKYDKAKLNLFKSIDLAKSQNYRYIIQKNYLKLSEIFEETDQISEALFYYKAHIKIKDEIFSQESETKMLTLEVEYETEKKEKQILNQRVKLAEKNMMILLVIFLLILSIIVSYFYIKNQKIKVKNLKQIRILNELNDKIEFQNQLNQQKIRISKDLHDNIGSKLSFIASSIQNLKYIIPLISEQDKQRIDHISHFSKQTISELRDTIWAMNNENITLEDIKIRLANYIVEANQLTNSQLISLKVNPNLPLDYKFNSEEGINLYRIIQESINNAFKHASASSINIYIETQNNFLYISIGDNGQGFDLEKVEKGNGLKNIQNRAHLLKGFVKFESTTKGTVVKLSIPLN